MALSPSTAAEATAVAGCASDEDVARLETQVAELETKLEQAASVPPTPSPTPTEDEKLRENIRPHLEQVAALMSQLSTLREAGGYAEGVAPECTQNRITVMRAQGYDDPETLCPVMYEIVSAGRETLLEVGGQWARGWTSFPRIPMLRDLVDIANELHRSLEVGVMEGKSMEDAGTYRREAGVGPMMERHRRQAELVQELEDRYQDLLLFVRD